MQKIITLIAVILLSGCSMFGATFDNNEYASFARLQTQSHFAINSCTTPDELRLHINSMVEEVEFLHIYTKHLPRNNETHKIVTLIRANITELKNGYAKGKKSTIYCKIKLNTLSQSIQRAMEAVAIKAH